MYNRYICKEDGTYTRIPEEDHSSDQEPSGQEKSSPGAEQQSAFRQTPPNNGGCGRDGLTGFLRHILDQLHLDSIDTGDLLLLGLLFFLAREDADEELLIALGLLLIL